jgi:protein-disulfide isomerase
MTGVDRPWYKRPVAIIGAGIAVLIGAWFVAFVWSVGSDVYLIKSGQMNPLESAKLKNFQSSVSHALSNADVTQKDIERIEQGDNPTLGNPKAKLHIVEFLDYGCPFCKQEAPVVRSFMAAHLDDAYLVIRDFPLTDLHPSAMDDAIAARCVFAQGDSEKYWMFYDRLFASQDAQAPADLRIYAEQIGVDLSVYDACVAAKQPQGTIQQSLQDGLDAGVGATPTFFFNGFKVPGAIDADSFNVIAQQVEAQSIQH